MNIQYVPIASIKPYKNNPRKNKAAVGPVAESIKQFGFRVPIVLDKDGVIVAGHTRLAAAKQLKLSRVPCVVADDLTEDQVRAFRLADNKVSEFAEWDAEKLGEELAEISDIDMSLFGFDGIDDGGKSDAQGDEKYSNAINIPQYEITGDNPSIDALADMTKYNELVMEIENENLPPDVAEFLKLAATRHIAFNYRNVAEWYAHAPENVQRLMENSALVLIDFENAIRNGYVKMTTEIDELMKGCVIGGNANDES